MSRSADGSSSPTGPGLAPRRVSRRSVLRAGLGLAAGVAALIAAPGSAVAAVAATTAAITGGKVKDLTGPVQTGQFAASWIDLDSGRLS